MTMVYLAHPQTGHFFEVTEDDNHLRVRRGEVGKPCLVYAVSWKTAGRGRENFERLVKEWQQKGYVQTRPSQDIVEGSKASQLWADDIEEHPAYERFFELGWASELRGQRKRLMYFPHGLRYDGDLDLEEIADMGLEAGLIIEGDVRVSGVFSQLTYTYPGSTLITGSVYAHSLGHKDSYLRIDGDVRVENVVYGEYNDGSLQIGGDVYGGVWISADHGMWAAGKYFLPRFSSHDYDTNWNDLSPKVLDLDGHLDWDALREFIYARKSPLRKGFVFTPPQVEILPEEQETQTSELYKQVRSLAEADDVEGLTQLLETWPEQDNEWAEYVRARLQAPSSTPEQKARLSRLIKPVSEESWKTPSDLNERFDRAPPLIRALVMSIRQDSIETILEALSDFPQPELIVEHSWLVLMETVDKIQHGETAYLRVLERLLELGAQPETNSEDAFGYVQYYETAQQSPILALFGRFYPHLEKHLQPAPPEVLQIEPFAACHAEIKRIIEAMKGKNGAKRTLRLLDIPPPRDMFPPHSHVLLINALLKNKDFPNHYLPVIERLIELGADPRLSNADGRVLLNDELVTTQPEVLKLMQGLYPDYSAEPQGWIVPESGQVEEPEQAHPQIRELLELLAQTDNSTGQENWTLILKALEQPPEREFIISHSWILLLNLVRYCYRNNKYVQVIERLLELGAMPHIEFDGMNMGVVRYAQLLDQYEVLERFYTHYPELRPSELSGLEVLQKLLHLGSAGADLDATEYKTWLESVKEIGVVVGELPHLPEAIGRLLNLEKLELFDLKLKDKNLPQSIAGLSKLQSLVLMEMKLKTIPQWIADLHQLELLNLGNNLLSTIPEGIFALPKLCELHLFKNPLQSLPDVSRLTSLECLNLQGTPITILPEGLLQLSRLKHLLLDRKRLKSISQNQAELIDALKTRGVRFSLEETEESQHEPRPKKKSTRVRNALKCIKQLNEQGNQFQMASPPKAAEGAAVFEQVLEASREFLEDYPDDFVCEYLFALQGRLWCVNELVSNPALTDQRWTADQAMQLARDILTLAQAQFNFYYSSMGELSRSAQTLAHNTLAWYLHQRGEDAEALEHANAAMGDIDYSAGEETYATVLENKIRILLALDRGDEAYATVYQMHRRFPELEYFQKLTQTPEYQKWDEAN